METFLIVLHVVTCVVMILVILLQSGKGAEISASFGGSSQTVFGASGGANFFTKFTAGAAVIFMVTSIALTLLKANEQTSLFDKETPVTTAPAPQESPVAPATK